jgi:hypothetical protein
MSLPSRGGLRWRRFANARLANAYRALTPTKNSAMPTTPIMAPAASAKNNVWM